MGEDRQVVGQFNKCKPDFFYFLLRLLYLPICSPVDGRQALQGTISQLAGSVGLHSPYALFFGHLLLSSLLMLCSSCSMDRPVTKQRFIVITGVTCQYMAKQSTLQTSMGWWWRGVNLKYNKSGCFLFNVNKKYV